MARMKKDDEQYAVEARALLQELVDLMTEMKTRNSLDVNFRIDATQKPMIVSQFSVIKSISSETAPEPGQLSRVPWQ